MTQTLVTLFCGGTGLVGASFLIKSYTNGRTDAYPPMAKLGLRWMFWLGVGQLALGTAYLFGWIPN